MRALVAYMSSTGNTKKVAEAIYGELTCEKEIKPIDGVQDIGGYGISFLGFPTHQSGPDKRASEFLRKQCTKGRNVALFVTHCAPEDAPHVQEWMAKFKTAASGTNLVGFFDCQGEASRGVRLVMRLSSDKGTRDYAKTDGDKGQPDEARLARARAFAKETMNRIT